MIDKQIVKDKIAAFLRQPVSKLEDEAVLTDLVTESLILVEMIIELQEEFGIRLVQGDFKDVRTVGDLTELLTSRAK